MNRFNVLLQSRVNRIEHNELSVMANTAMQALIMIGHERQAWVIRGVEPKPQLTIL